MDALDSGGYNRSRISSRAIEAYLIQASNIDLSQLTLWLLIPKSKLPNIMTTNTIVIGFWYKYRYWKLASFMLTRILEILLLMWMKESSITTLAWWGRSSLLRVRDCWNFSMLYMRKMQKRSAFYLMVLLLWHFSFSSPNFS